MAMSATNLSIQQTTANNSSVYLYGTNFGGSSSSTTNDQWVQTAPSLDFRLDSRGVQTVQIRFRDGNNNVFTPAAVNSVFFDPFPHFPVGVKPLVVNDGAAVTTTALVNLHIIAPESSFAFSVTSDSDVQSVLPLVWRDIPTDVKSSLYGVPWKVFEFDAPFILKGPPGPRTIYVQLKNELGDRSEAYSAVIDYQPPTP